MPNRSDIYVGRLRLRGQWWAVYVVPSLPDGRVGECDYTARRIRVLAGLRGDLLREVLLHEAAHAWRWCWPEPLVAALAAWQTKVLRLANRIESRQR